MFNKLLILVMTAASYSPALPQTDSLWRQKNLQNVEVRGDRLRSHLNGSMAEATLIDMSLMDDMPRILGNADPIHYVQTLPGVQSNAEMDAGLHIQGCDNQHNVISIDGVPIYNVAHLLGFFSVFNASHFQQMLMTKAPTTAAVSNHLGGQIDMQVADTIMPRWGGVLSVGPISSQGTLRLPLSSHSQLTFSARSAYINLLYSQWLKIEEEQLRYNFDDFNLTWTWRPNSNNTVWLEAYYGHDHMGYESGGESNGSNGITGDLNMKWQNAFAALHWNSMLRGTQVRQTLYTTHFDNRFAYNEETLTMRLPSSITDWTYRLQLSRGRLETGAEAVCHNISPQVPEIGGNFAVEPVRQEREHTLEASLYADYRLPLGKHVETTLSTRASAYRYDSHTTYYGVDPMLTLSYHSPIGNLRLQGAVRHQYLFRAGFSNVGLPTECWFGANADRRPQYSYNLSALYETFLHDRMYRLQLELYHKTLRHQLEYSGNLFDLLYSEYDLTGTLLSGKGLNYGLNIIMEKRRGTFTGWLSYSFGRAKRKFDNAGYEGWYPANHERIHELNIVATYQLSRRWSLGGTYVLASGTPYTAPQQFYVINGNIISQYGQHNANRLKPYRRLDLSVNYDLCNRGGRRSGLNFSLYNVTMARNELFCRLKITKKRQFANRPYRFMLPILPSLNYYLYI